MKKVKYKYKLVKIEINLNNIDFPKKDKYHAKNYSC